MKKIILPLLLIIGLNVHAQDSEDFHLDEAYPIAADGTIKLVSDDADISIIGENRNDVAVKIDRVVSKNGVHMSDGDFKIEVSITGGNLNIIEYSGGSSFSIGNISEDYSITIHAPKGVSLDLKGDDDEYKINGMAGSIIIDADDVEVKMTNCKTKSIDINIDDGEVDIDEAYGYLRARMDDGELRVLNGSFDEIDFLGDDSEAYIATSISSSGSYLFRGDDAGFDIDILGGGGQFIISHDDGSIRASSSFKLEQESDSKSVYYLPGGNAEVQFRGDDMTVRLSAQLSN